MPSSDQILQSKGVELEIGDWQNLTYNLIIFSVLTKSLDLTVMKYNPFWKDERISYPYMKPSS